MKKIAFVLTVFALSLLLPYNLFAEIEGLQERYPHLQHERTLNYFGKSWRTAKPNEYVYLIPAHLGGTIFVLIGNVVGTPVKAIYNVCTLNFTGDDYLPPVDFCTRYLAPVGGYLLGGPFWALEKVFYEIPAGIISPPEDKYRFADDE
ncbi:MAG: hypothetical protein PHV59_04140 [Victivallales bacterium]|nr:hypothetical protein [Victivallales bacterium]